MNMKNRKAEREVKRGGVTREQEEENCSSHRERPLKVPAHVNRLSYRAVYSETGFHIGMDCNFVCLWLSHNCN
jgi:hypothetical protein